MLSPLVSPRSAAKSKASKTPAMDDSSLLQLTPRSKVKAMMAAVSEDSELDERNTCRSVQKGVRSQTKKTNIDVAEGQRDVDNASIMPQGGLAARLNGQHEGRLNTNASSDVDSDKENAYARVKKQLMKKRLKTARATTQEDRPHDEAISSQVSKYQKSFSLQPMGIDEKIASAVSEPNSRGQEHLSGILVAPAPASEASSQPNSPVQNASDSEFPENTPRNSKFFELVARKKAECQAKQAQEEAKKKRRIRQAPVEEMENEDFGSLSDTENEEVDRKLTQHNRPTRKASRRALEEMSRETQRMSRNMQLSHQVKTKKRITKESLLARFHFGTTTVESLDNATLQERSNSASSVNTSDREDTDRKETPPTSPLQPDDSEKLEAKEVLLDNDAPLQNALPSPLTMEHDELPDMTNILSQPTRRFEKGKGRAVEIKESINTIKNQIPKKFDAQRRHIKIDLSRLPPRGSIRASDSDSDLEVVSSYKYKRKIDVFERLPKVQNQDVRPLQNLRALAHLNSPPRNTKGKSKHSISLVDMQMSLQQRARQQAVEERKAKIEELKARGIVFQTAEEKEKEQIEVEDLLEKARKENEAIREKEKMAARREKLANGDVQSLDESSDNDEEYQENGKGQQDIELSGSDDDEETYDDELAGSEGDDDIDMDDEEHEHKEPSGLIDDQASSDSRDEEDIEADDEEEETSVNLQAPRPRRARRVVDEDDDIDDEYDGPSTVNRELSSLNTMPAVEVPDLFSNKPHNIPMGMTQAFAATMAETQTQFDESDVQDSSFFLGCPPDPALPVLHVEDSLLMVKDTQDTTQPSLSVADDATPNRIHLQCSQSQIGHDVAGALMQPAATQMSEIPDPTQDAGFVMSSPAPEQRFVSEPPSTVDTLIIPGIVDKNSPVIKKRGRLHRRKSKEQVSDNEDVSKGQAEQNFQRESDDAFTIMKKARKKAAQREDFNRKKSEAKEMIEEQAQESEDEYAGLGGASDDDSGGEDDDFDHEMIDREKVDVQERKLAAFHADKERRADEAEIQKIHKDIHNGGFRRKRTTEFDLSDSDDDAEARRRRKQREFTKMRKALLENENVGKIAEDPKKLAFLKAIEDRDDDGDLDFLHLTAEDSFRIEMATQEGGDPQSYHQGQESHPEDPTPHKGKRALEESAPDKTNMRPPATSRRTQAPRKPATLDEIRESVSFLVEEPGAVPLPDPSSSASEDDETTIHSTFRDENHRNPRRTNGNPIIDRLTLKRQSSLSASTTSNLAFHSAATSMTNTFFPSLLRRAGTSSLGSSQGADANGISHASTERAAGGGEKGDFVRRGGTKRSSVNFAARETQKGRIVEGVERRRRKEREKLARERGGGLVSLSRTNTWEG